MKQFKVTNIRQVARDFSDFNDDDLTVDVELYENGETKTRKDFHICKVPGEGWHRCSPDGEAHSMLNDEFCSALEDAIQSNEVVNHG